MESFSDHSRSPSTKADRPAFKGFSAWRDDVTFSEQLIFAPLSLSHSITPSQL
jgi:hypothetical protein